MPPVTPFASATAKSMIAPSAINAQWHSATVMREVRTISIRLTDAIEAIKFVFDDDTEWQVGHDGSGEELTMNLLKGEFITEVQHETLKSFRCAGAAVQFTTSCGRVFKYAGQGTSALATGCKDEITTLAAPRGHHIVGLEIRKGVLRRLETQALRRDSLRQLPGFAVIYTAAKEDGDVTVEEIGDSTAAHKFFRERTRWARAKAGRAVMLLDVKKHKHVRRYGKREGLTTLEQWAEMKGYIMRHETEPSVLSVLLVVWGMLASAKDWVQLTIVVVLLLLSGYFELSSVSLCGQILGLATGSNEDTKLYDGPSGWMVESFCHSNGGCENDMHLVCAHLAVFFVLIVLSRLFDTIQVAVHHYSCAVRNQTMHLDLLGHVLRLDQCFWDTHTRHQITSGMNVHSLNNLFCWNVPYMLERLLRLFTLSVFMLQMNVFLGTLALVTTFSSILVIEYPLERLQKVSRKVERKIEHMTNTVKDDCLSNASTIKQFASEEKHLELFAEQLKRQEKVTRKIVMLRVVKEFAKKIVKGITIGLILYHGRASIDKGTLSAADLTTFFLMFRQFQEVYGSLRWHYELLIREFGDIDRYKRLKETQPQMIDGNRDLNLDTDQQLELRLEDVSFEYPSRPGQLVLNKVSHTFKPGKVTAIVGPSGAGKSTIVKMLLRLYDPTSGSVICNGESIKGLKVVSLREHIGIVDQHPSLLIGSLRDNIGYGKVSSQSDPTDEEIKTAASVAAADSFISSFSGGYDTQVGAGGSKISGGQRQRIAIARAVIRDPKLLILDEATAALDTENERHVADALGRLMVGRTTIVIAHRLSTIANADEVLCVDDGTIQECGTHAQLMELNGRYSKLVEAQLMTKELVNDR